LIIGLAIDSACFKKAYTDKKENQIFLIYKEIQSGAVAKSYMRKCAIISPYMRRPLVIYDFATAPLNFLIYKKNLIIFFISVIMTAYNWQLDCNTVFGGLL
jgi:hypothetical protein